MSLNENTARQTIAQEIQQPGLQHLLKTAELFYDRSISPDFRNEQCAMFRKQASDIAQQLYDFDETRTLALNLSARIAIDEGFYSKAGELLHRAVSLDPEDASLYYSLGHVFLARQQLDEAEKSFTRAIELKADFIRAASSLAYTRTRQGRYTEAFQDYRRLIHANPGDRHIRTKIVECASRIRADRYDQELTADIVFLLKLDEVDYSSLSTLAMSMIRHCYRISKDGSSELKPTLAELSANTLVTESLTKISVNQPDVERFFTAVRKQLLLESLAGSDLKKEHLALARSLSLQASVNEYVFYINRKEQELLTSLRKLIRQVATAPQWKPQDLAGAFLLYSMYLPASSLGISEALSRPDLLSWPEWCRDTLSHGILELTEEQQSAARIPALSTISDSTSVRVRQQYEENPYPRWLHLGYNTPTNYGRAIEQEFSGFRAPGFFNTGDTDVLIAGCGTGRHALKVAKYFRNVNVTAIDLSTRSLAYAEKMARRYQVDNIGFIQADILDLSALKKKYHVIESSGVLHHMADPEKGWQSLTGRLQPGGLIKVALYSRQARQIITKSRELISRNKLTSSNQSIRLFRQAILQDAHHASLRGIVESADFYNMSGCRDLLFHEHEVQFDLLQIQEIIARLGLTFIGMVASPVQQRNFSQMFSHPAKFRDLEAWHEFEQRYPESFGSMYQLYCQKPFTYREQENTTPA